MLYSSSFCDLLTDTLMCSAAAEMACSSLFCRSPPTTYKAMHLKNVKIP